MFTMKMVKNADFIRFEASDDVIVEMDKVEFARQSKNKWLVTEFGDRAYEYNETDKTVLDEIKWLEEKGYYDCTCYVPLDEID